MSKINKTKFIQTLNNTTSPEYLTHCYTISHNNNQQNNNIIIDNILNYYIKIFKNNKNLDLATITSIKKEIIFSLNLKYKNNYNINNNIINIIYINDNNINDKLNLINIINFLYKLDLIDNLINNITLNSNMIEIKHITNYLIINIKNNKLIKERKYINCNIDKLNINELFIYTFILIELYNKKKKKKIMHNKNTW